MRVAAIDCFRGLSIVLMVFFTMLLALSSNIPDFITHNLPNSIHIGDFVLPMFLFASGMSIVFFREKHIKKGRLEYVLDIIERAGKLAIIWLFLSPFSAAGFMGFDELILGIILFLAVIIIAEFPEKAIVLGVAVPIIFYLILHYMGGLPDFSAHYIGGYASTIFYLPIMLAGFIAAKTQNRGPVILGSLAVGLILSFFIPPYKLIASPSFMMLAVFFSLLIFELIERFKIRNSHLEYLGKKPLRYWILMYVVIIIPVLYYAYYSGIGLPLGFAWEEAVVINIGLIGFLYLLSKVVDRIPIISKVM